MPPRRKIEGKRNKNYPKKNLLRSWANAMAKEKLWKKKRNRNKIK